MALHTVLLRPWHLCGCAGHVCPKHWNQIVACSFDVIEDTVDGQNPAPPRMMIIRLFAFAIYYMPGAGFLPSTV